MSQYIPFSSYSPAADIVVVAICLVMFILVFFSYISRTRSSKLFKTVVVLVLVAAYADILFYTVAAMRDHLVFANWVRFIYRSTLLMIFVYYIAYICEITHYENQKVFLCLGNLIFAVTMLADIIATVKGLTFTIDDAGIHFNRTGLFFYAYLADAILCLILLTKARRLIYRRIVFGFYGTVAISFMILIIQGLKGQTSFTVASLLFPVIAMMYVMHSNPYDALLGTNDFTAMQDHVQYCYKKRQDFVFMSLYMRAFEEEGKELPDSMQASIRQFTARVVRNARVFKVGKGHMILIFLKKQYPDFEKQIQSMLEAFYPLYEQFQYDYKIVIGESIDEISRKNEYVSYIKDIHRGMQECSVHRVDAEDVQTFNRSEYILKELADIHRQGDLNDPRVLVYCQPVLNVRTGKYDTAEALMRLELKETGIVYPNHFIPLAEDQGYIHTLTEIILHKTCGAIRRFTEAGYEIRRISINVSVPELKDERFCGDIIDIIKENGIPADKIAIELTESQNEGDFMLMKRKIDELRAYGLKFYLDDFGTGYSNMERIMELPFDIIKFDRSLVIASGTESRFRKMVANLASMFSDMDYYVLYEGVEKDTDEAMCKDMSATYLQGFKYSKPTPIEGLKDYLSPGIGKACE